MSTSEALLEDTIRSLNKEVIEILLSRRLAIETRVILHARESMA